MRVVGEKQNRGATGAAPHDDGNAGGRALRTAVMRKVAAA